MQNAWYHKQITKQLKYAVENKWHSDLFTNGKNLTAKTPPGDFQVTTPKTPLLSQQAVTSKRIPSTLPIDSWTLTSIPNWTYSVVTVPIFDARLPSMWLTNCMDPSMRLQSPTKKVVGCKVLQFIHTMKIKKILGHKTLRCTYTATSSQEWWTRARTSSLVTICLNRVFSMLVQLENLLTALKIILLYV